MNDMGLSAIEDRLPTNKKLFLWHSMALLHRYINLGSNPYSEKDHGLRKRTGGDDEKRCERVFNFLFFSYFKLAHNFKLVFYYYVDLLFNEW